MPTTIITAAGVTRLARATRGVRQILRGSFSVEAPVTITFSHEPSFPIPATPGRDIPIPPGDVPPLRPWTLEASVATPIHLWFESFIVAIPPILPSQPPDWQPIVPPVPTHPIEVPPPVPTHPIEVPPPTTEPPPAGALLTAADLTYLGLFPLPLEDGGQVYWSFSNGALAGRVVNGEHRLFIAGSVTQGDKVCEVAVPTTLYRPPDSSYYIPEGLERARLVRAWGDIYQGRKVFNNPQEIPNVRGLHWDGEKLLWAYGSSYAVSGWHEPSLGASVLNDATGAVEVFGAWRTGAHSQRARGYMTLNPRTGKTCIGAPITSGNGASPWGLSLYELPPIATTTPPSAASDQAAIAFQTPALVEHNSDSKQERRAAPYSICGWTVPYDPAQGVFLYPAETTFGSLDFISAVAWVKTADKEGVIAFGSLVTGEDAHKWYGPTTCPHGRADPRGESVGDYADQQWPMAWIFDPNALATAPVPMPVSTICPAIGNYLSQHYMFGGAWFEPVSRRIYVMECGSRDKQGPYSYCPVVHVFEVRAPAKK